MKAQSRCAEAKLRPLGDESTCYGAGYRGHRFVEWRLVYATKGDTSRTFEEYAAGCRFCLQFWGWTPDLGKAIRLACAMDIKGCPHCEKRLSARRMTALRKHVSNAKVRVCSDVLTWNGRDAFGCDRCKKRVGKRTYAKVQKIMRKKIAS